ncbi:MAG: PHP domain-containing protein, partial [Dehalococcoidia bacterium]|nr:PHP domain-containing protein [Dehalococcoidia bacterium]
MVPHPRTPLGAHALRPLNPPRPIAVQVGDDGAPRAIRRPDWRRPRPVALILDHWRLDDEWWRERPVQRQYYAVLLADDTLLTVFFDAVANEWREQHEPVRVLAPPPPTDTPLPDEYVELHLHTCYSFLAGASRPEEFAARAVALGYSALAVTDTDNLCGALEFANALAAVGVQPITGVALTLRHGLVAYDLGPVVVTLLAETRLGYANLCRLITAAHRTSPRDAVALDPALLAEHADGVIALSGGRRSEIDQLVVRGEITAAEAAARALGAIFGPTNTFIELQHNLAYGDSARVAQIAAIARHIGLPIVATGDVWYHDRHRHRLHDALTALRRHQTLDSSHQVRFANSERFLQPQATMIARWRRYPDAIANTVRIRDRCRAFDLAAPNAIGYRFPDFARSADEAEQSADEALAAYCWARFAERYAPAITAPELRAKARDQLAEELQLVAKHQLSGFFLVYRDLQQLATDVARRVRGANTVRGASGLPPGRGRGSSVSSIICYLIGLSHVDPVRAKLFFRRFLN